MDHGHFDDLTRSVAGGTGTRRAILRLLAGSALGGVAARLGLAAGAEAMPKGKKHPSKKNKKKRPPRAKRKGQGQLQAEGKGKGKKHNKKPKPPQPPPDPPCEDGKGLCPDGKTCVDIDECCPNALPPLCQPCQDAVCEGGELVCQDIGRVCSDGSCAVWGKCCPGEKPCGGGCIAETSCCPNTERECFGEGNGCVPKDACCPAEKQCGNECVPMDTCCPGEKVCDYVGGAALCVPQNACCELTAPLCGDCQEEFCDNGTWNCRSTCQTSDAVCCQGTCFSPCSNGCGISDDCSACNKPPAGKVYCALQDRCITYPCGATESFNPNTCECECPPGYVDCEGRCSCAVRDGMACKSGICCFDDNRRCAVSGQCCFGYDVCTPEGCCPYYWVHEGHCVIPGS